MDYFALVSRNNVKMNRPGDTSILLKFDTSISMPFDPALLEKRDKRVHSLTSGGMLPPVQVPRSASTR